MPIREGKMWPDAGWNVGQGRVGFVASDRLISRAPTIASDFRDDTWTLPSDRAFDVFIKRAEEGDLWASEGFLEALRGAE